mmetsp:Transcript_93590/g.268299  ORF Transcript_93590/g.268299 Transcript_93590/m.268299 type:complete len:256 (-) Transcript_93590:10-777(-)
MPRLNATEFQVDPCEKQRELHHCADAREAWCCRYENLHRPSHACTILHGICQALLARQVAQLVEDLKLSADRSVHMRVHWQSDRLQPTLLPHSEALEAMFPQHPTLDGRSVPRLAGGGRRCHGPEEAVLGVGKDPSLLRPCACVAPREVARRSSWEGLYCTCDEIIVWRGNINSLQHQSSAYGSEVVNPNVLQAAEVHTAPPLLERPRQHLQQSSDDAVELGDERRMGRGVEPDLGQECEGLRLHARDLPQRLCR